VVHGLIIEDQTNPQSAAAIGKVKAVVIANTADVVAGRPAALSPRIPLIIARTEAERFLNG